jgi:rhodanese-related sulfurtransferase
VDLRDRTAYARGFVHGTVNVGISDSFSTYVGWLAPWNRPVTLVGDTADEVAAAQRQLVRIGIDRPAAAATGGVEVYGGGGRGSYRIVDFATLVEAWRQGATPVVLDVRRDDEWVQGGVRGAVHVPLHRLEREMGQVPDGEIWVHCESGYRASIAVSLLARAGRMPVLIDDDYDRAVELDLTSPG